MSKYIANPVEIEAYKVICFNHLSLDTTLQTSKRVKIKQEALAIYSPKPGDFWVVDESNPYGGYFVAKEVFEWKYRPLPFRL